MRSDLWYALKVKPRFERCVDAQLRNKGYAPFLPCYTLKRRAGQGTTKAVELPLFHGYVFCQLDINEPLRILTTPGVNFIVGVGALPEPIAEGEIESIRTVVNSGLHYEPSSYQTGGQLVIVEHGPLAGLVGLTTERSNRFRLVFSIHLVMRSVAVVIDRSWVKPVDRLSSQHRSLIQPFVATAVSRAS
jgi:transcriptional antiterminator RfaH